VEPVELNADGRDLFASFECTIFRQRWTRDIENTIRERLADELTLDPTLSALGFIVEGQLAALIVWRPSAEDAETWEIALLATNRGFRRKGHYAERLKRELLRRAADAGVLVVSRKSIATTTRCSISTRA